MWFGQGNRRDYYDDVHYSPSAGEERTERKLSVSDPWYRLIGEFLQLREFDLRGRTVLEVGCGLGGFSLHMARQGAAVTALDFSSSAVGAARALGSERGRIGPEGRLPHYLTADAKRLPFPDATFDLVVCAETLEHTFALGPCMEEFFRVCVPGGLVAVTVPNSVLSLPVDAAVCLLGLGQPQTPVNYFTVRRAAERAGLAVVDAYGTNFCRLMFSEDELPPVVRRVTQRVGDRLEGRMSRQVPFWPVAAGTVGFLLRRPDRADSRSLRGDARLAADGGQRPHRDLRRVGDEAVHTQSDQ
jgi:ubiquinone/menaquinone biosynthesis C-methylase UbiE